MSAGGKGDAPRPLSIPQADFAARWDAIFGRKPAEPPELEKCPFCGIRTERPCDAPPPAMCDTLNEHLLAEPEVKHLPPDDTEGGLA